MSHELSWSGNEVIISFEGLVDFHEITEADDKIYGDPRFEKQKYQIWDFSRIESFNLSSVEARVIGGIDSRTSLWNDDIKLAVVSRDKHVIRMTREYEESMKDTNWQIRMFDTFHEAYAWCVD
jgi:hypothetical protein